MIGIILITKPVFLRARDHRDKEMIARPTNKPTDLPTDNLRSLSGLVQTKGRTLTSQARLRRARRSVILGGIFVVVVGGIFFLAGIFLFV